MSGSDLLYPSGIVGPRNFSTEEPVVRGAAAHGFATGQAVDESGVSGGECLKSVGCDMGCLNRELLGRLAEIDNKLELVLAQVVQQQRISREPSRQGGLGGVTNGSCCGLPNSRPPSSHVVKEAWSRDGIHVQTAMQYGDGSLAIVHDKSQDSLGAPGHYYRDSKNSGDITVEPDSRKDCISDVRAALWSMSDDPDGGFPSRCYSMLMYTFIISSVIFTLLQTAEEPIISRWTGAIVETAIDATFTLDFLVRLTCCPMRGPFMRNTYNFMDCFGTVLTWSIRITAGFIITDSSLDTFEGQYLLHIVPILRMMKILRKFKSFDLVLLSALKVYVDTVPTLLFVFLTALSFSTLIYAVEPRDNVPTFPSAIWFTLVTISTVGYGDMKPSTNAGYMIMGLLVSFSVLIMALPLGIIGQSISEIWQDRERIMFANWARERLDQWGYSVQDIPRLFWQYGHKGALTFEQFDRMITDMNIGLKEESLRKLFMFFDEDGGGTIDCDEFVKNIFPEAHKEESPGAAALPPPKRLSATEPLASPAAAVAVSPGGSSSAFASPLPANVGVGAKDEAAEAVEPVTQLTVVTCTCE
eukprot:TRINITY_DN27290_c0_g1_i1.p1 TRINITY_DN27290_c0_g1~~TRINITY_DN27290_c0_g1_i1.p1  ORF type:complete len:584 (+),score=102.83 TRINITY_DN27290_c0_g1_i1:77-1828(+)